MYYMTTNGEYESEYPSLEEIFLVLKEFHSYLDHWVRLRVMLKDDSIALVYINEDDEELSHFSIALDDIPLYVNAIGMLDWLTQFSYELDGGDLLPPPPTIEEVELF